MARIRTIKPEMFWSEDLAACDITAMVTFQGLLTQADDSGRFLAHPAIIAGFVWPLRIEHTPAHVARDLDQLAAVGIICRYTGCDDKDYLHVVKWEKHQKIDRPSASRMPRCPVHQAQRMCSECGSAACPASPSPPLPRRRRRPRQPGLAVAPRRIRRVLVEYSISRFRPILRLRRSRTPRPSASVRPRDPLRRSSRSRFPTCLEKPQVRRLSMRARHKCARARCLDLGSWILDLYLRGARRQRLAASRRRCPPRTWWPST